MVMRSYWIIIERLENWQSDKDSGFTFFGIPERHKNTASKIRKGDFLISYVSSNISSFADIRKATSDGIEELKYELGYQYDVALPYCIKTSSVVCLPREKWIDIKSIVSELELTRTKKKWGSLFRTSIRSISESDWEKISQEVFKRV